MKVTCTGRRVTLKPSFIENAEKRLAKLDKFFPDEAQAQVTVTVEKSGQTVEIMLRSKDLAMRAEKTDERMEDALADAVDLLTRRVVKYRKRLGTKLTAAAAEIPATEPEESMDIVREKHFALKPCSTEEAILQMNLLGHSFFVFRNTDFGDAIWWASMNLTTVGADIFAVTAVGKILTVLLPTLGMMMFPIFTVYITNLIQQSNEKKKQYYAEEEEKKAPAQGTT